MNLKWLKPQSLFNNQLITDFYNYLKNSYNVSKDLFSRSSPFFHITEAIEDISKIQMLHIEDSIVESNLITAQRSQSIHGLSRLAGHNPQRANCSKGNGFVTLLSDAPTDWEWIKIEKNPIVRSSQNGQVYTIHSKERYIYISGENVFQVSLLQGEFQTQNLISEGLSLQTYNVQSRKRFDIDNDYVYVYVNDEQWNVYTDFLDLKRDENACVIRTGIDGGIDIIFGNGYFGKIPGEGANVKVEYLENIGAEGNLDTISIDWVFETEGTTNRGDKIDLNRYLVFNQKTPFVAGGDRELPSYTKMILNGTTSTNVLANPKDFLYFFQKKGRFSYVKTWIDEQIKTKINILLVPNLTLLLKNYNYFNLPLERFILSEFEKDIIIKELYDSEQMIIGLDINLINPVLRKYIVNVYLRVYENYNIDELRNHIIGTISDLFVTSSKKNYVSKSDLIAQLENYEDIDSVNVEFVSELNEKAIKDGFYTKNVNNQNIVIQISENSNPLIGLNTLGDIEVLQNEIPIIRGGWSDSRNVIYDELPSKNSTSSFNMFINSIAKR